MSGALWRVPPFVTGPGKLQLWAKILLSQWPASPRACCKALYPKKSDDVTAFLTICVQFPKGSVLNVLMVPSLCQSGQVSMLLNEQSKPRNAGGNFRPIMHWEETVRCFNCSLIAHFALSSESLFPFLIFLSSQI